MGKKYFYERNSEMIDSDLNKKFEDILLMSDADFEQWVRDLRKFVVYLWDERGQPPRVGYDESEIIEQFRGMEKETFTKSIFNDLHAGETTKAKGSVFRSTKTLGNAVNQFFPTMMKTRINYTSDTSAGKSIYDFFSKDELFNTFHTYAKRHFKRDSFYSYSVPVRVMENERYGVLPVAETGPEWIKAFEAGTFRQRKWDYFLCANSEEKYTGYSEEMRALTNLRVTQQDVKELSILPEHCKTQVSNKEGESYVIRVYEKGQKLFPIGLKAFRISFCQYAVNFPPLIAKYVFEKYTEEWKHEKKIFVWDPSAGWGGRLLGAMSVDMDRHIVYLANDPNTDHNTTPGRTKYHELYDFYRDNVNRDTGNLWPKKHTEFGFWQMGSEEMQFDPGFQLFRGKLSLVFTSPPYFSKEAYSEDEGQSYKKFGEYAAWRDGFLKETLKTAVEWLRPGGYLAWNIADVVFAGETLPLEEDSRKFLKELGMIEETPLKMCLASMPGGNRLDKETGLPKAKHFCKIKDGNKPKLWLKYEPIFIFKKPQ